MDIAAKFPMASDYQINIFKFVAEQAEAIKAGTRVRNGLAAAVAGSGKTWTIVNAASLIPENVPAIFLAFNKDIAEELKTKLPSHVTAKTLNSFGHGIWWGHIKRTYNVNVRLDTKKIPNIMSEIMTREERKEYGDDVRYLVSMCRANGVVPSGVRDAVSANGLTDSDSDLLDILLTQGRTIPVQKRHTVFEYVREVLRRDLAMETVIDFDDQKYLPVVKRVDGRKLSVKKHKVVFVDECQDLNAVDFELVNMLRNVRGNDNYTMVFGVGDKNQSIYAFRGAGSDSIDKFKTYFKAEEYPLSITYRCGKNIVDHAHSIYPGIEAAPNAIDGEVKYFDKYDCSIFTVEDMVICRNNAPLISMAYKLIANKIPVMVKGRDIGQGIIALINRLEAANVTDLSVKLQEWRNTQIDIIQADENPSQDALNKIEDLAHTISIFIEHNTDNKIETIINEINSLFSNDKEAGKLTLSTIHRSKGLEAERVFILDIHLMYPKYIKEGSIQWTQETNVNYVAVTRAKSLLGYINSENFTQ